MASTTMFKYNLRLSLCVMRFAWCVMRRATHYTLRTTHHTTLTLRFSFFNSLRNNLSAAVVSAKRANAMRDNGLLTLGTRTQRRNTRLPVGPALASALFGMLAFW